MRTIRRALLGLVVGVAGGFIAGITTFMVGFEGGAWGSSDGFTGVMAGAVVVAFVFTAGVLGLLGGLCEEPGVARGLFHGGLFGWLIGLALMGLVIFWDSIFSKGAHLSDRIGLATLGCFAGLFLGAIVGAIATRVFPRRRTAVPAGDFLCPLCGGKLAAGASFCKHCQQWLC